MKYNVHGLGHNIWAVPPFSFCVLCGSHSKDRIGALARLCPNSSTTVHFSRAKSRLLEGRHPVTNRWLSRPYPVSKIVFCKLPEIREMFDELEIVDWPHSEQDATEYPEGSVRDAEV